MFGNSLPTGWILTRIDDVTFKGVQRTPADSEKFIYVDIGSIDRDAKRIARPQNLLGKDAPSRARKVINKGDIVVSLTRPNLNAVALVPSEYDNQIASTGFEVLKPIIVESNYLFSLVRYQSFINSISKKVQGALYPAAKSADVKEYEFPLPPLAEQKQIATKLDELLAQVDTIKTRLGAIPTILKRFRQSVLVAAVNGKLTEEWRMKNHDKLRNHEYVKQIIKKEYSLKKKPERNRVDKAHANDWFYSCKELIPASWLEAYLIDVTSLITCGVAKKPNYQEKGIPFLSAQNSKPFSPNLKKIKYISESDFNKFTVGGKPEKGDVLYSRVGAKFGEACQVPWDFDFSIYVSLTLLKPIKILLNGAYLTLFLNSHDGVLQAHGGIVGSGLQNLNVESVRKYKIPLPSLNEQKEIVRQVERFFLFADQIEKQVRSAQTRVNNLTQSILAKAFHGDLTAEWREQNFDLISGENSAETLLEKIKIEREAIKPTKKVRRKRQHEL